MKHINIYRRGEGCEIPNGKEYLLILASDLDANGNWIPTKTQSFETLLELRKALHEIMASGEGIIIQASADFGCLADELGLSLLVAEWGEKNQEKHQSPQRLTQPPHIYPVYGKDRSSSFTDCFSFNRLTILVPVKKILEEQSTF
jgi:hypothetical protein